MLKIAKAKARWLHQLHDQNRAKSIFTSMKPAVVMLRFQRICCLVGLQEENRPTAAPSDLSRRAEGGKKPAVLQSRPEHVETSCSIRGCRFRSKELLGEAKSLRCASPHSLGPHGLAAERVAR